MSTILRQVLEYFETEQQAVSLNQMARTLGVERAMLQNMIDYWVRKGKLREIATPLCTTCGSASGCPFVVTLPRYYELARTNAHRATIPLPNACSSCH